MMGARLRRWRHDLVRRWFFEPVSGRRADGSAVPGSRISPATLIEHEDSLVLGENVAIGPFCFLEASGGVVIGEGVQIASHVAIVTYSPHQSQRLLGPGYSAWPLSAGQQRPGWIAGPVHIGAYCFVGPHSLIEANTRIGRGSLVCAGSFVRGEYPDFVILEGRPARVVGDTRKADARLLVRHPELRVLYDSWALAPQSAALDGEPRLA